jgi:protein-S-isoprenylcysteine O-methyltransferase Ste14
MSQHTGIAIPLFQLKGRAAKIDLSAWISGFSYTLGILLVCHERMNVTPDQSAVITFSLIASLVAFFACVMMIQKHMRLSLMANTFGEPAHLVTTGIFQFSRNPIYVAFILPLASLAVMSLSAAILAIAFYITAMNLTVLRKEERDLRQLFGDTYMNYAAKAPRWIL